jgi:hypothetical protein
MLKTIAFAVAIGAAAALMPAGASAMPLAQDKAGIAGSDTVLLVREGCGRGMQWSERRRRCVPDSMRSQIRDAVRETGRCGIGFHWSERRGRCVRH